MRFPCLNTLNLRHTNILSQSKIKQTFDFRKSKIIYKKNRFSLKLNFYFGKVIECTVVKNNMKYHGKKWQLFLNEKFGDSKPSRSTKKAFFNHNNA